MLDTSSRNDQDTLQANDDNRNNSSEEEEEEEEDIYLAQTV